MLLIYRHKFSLATVACAQNLYTPVIKHIIFKYAWAAVGIKQSANKYIIYLLVTECLHTVCVTCEWPIHDLFRLPLSISGSRLLGNSALLDQRSSCGFPSRLHFFFPPLLKTHHISFASLSKRFYISRHDAWRASCRFHLRKPTTLTGGTDSLRRRFQNCAPRRRGIFKIIDFL